MTSSEEALSLPYVLIEPEGPKLPILLSIPHSGTEFPEHLTDKFKPEIIEDPVDTDWYLPHVFDFLVRYGITIIHSKYSRYVIDLNRDPSGRPLYSDGRTETGLFPQTTFSGERIYKDDGPSPEDCQGRLLDYFVPYYTAVDTILKEIKSQSRNVVFLNLHSTPRFLPNIRKDPLSDMVVSDCDGKSTNTKISDFLTAKLSRSGRFKVAYNQPLKGGHMIRHYGKPQNNVHAIQIELAQEVYLDEERGVISPSKAERLQPVLKDTFVSLAEALRRMP